MIPKFRAWDLKNKKWVDNLYLDFEGNCYYDVTEYHSSKQVVEYPLVPKTDVIIMQSTGQFDSSEPPKEIFKDDIVTTTRFTGNSYKTYTGVVKQLEGCWVIDTGDGVLYLWSEVDKNIIIGNIHQHPFLWR